MCNGIACILVSSFILAHSQKISSNAMTLPLNKTLEDVVNFLEMKFKMCDFSKRHLNVEKLKTIIYDFDKEKRVVLRLNSTANYIIKNLHTHNYNWVIYVPGFNNSVTVADGGSPEMLEAISLLPNTYYMVVNHTEYTMLLDDDFIKSYHRSIKYMYSISGAIAKFLVKVTREVNLKRFRLIGHSLGGQIVGKVGFIYRNKTKKSIERISALDPAGPCFKSVIMSPATDHAHIRSGAAKRVEVFHCNAGILGTPCSYADVDYFYNDKGVYQPGCDQFDVFTRSQCSHSMCPVIYAASVKNASWYPAVEKSEDGTTVYSGFVGSFYEGVFTVMTDKYPIDP